MANRKYQNRAQERKAKREQSNAFKKRAYVAMTFRFHRAKDADVLRALESCDNKLGLLRTLIRRWIIEGNGQDERDE